MAMFSIRLKENTQLAHRQLESIVIPKIKQIGSQADYETLLRLFYGYFSPLEKAIAPHVADMVSDYPERRKASALLNDLRSIAPDSKNSIPAECTDLPAINNSFQALGALYVMEGSTLGGQHITGMIRNKLGPEAPAVFFYSYGDDIQPMWDRFKQLLNNQDLNEAEQQLIINSANETFNKFKDWFSAN